MATPLEQLVTRNWNNAVPMSALFELTFVCNHACSFCYNCPTGRKEMSTAEIFDALRKMADFNILYLTLTGGEPLVRKDFFDIARRSRELGFALRIYTNGYLIDEPMARKIKEIANPLEMEISIHGAKPETHEKLTCVPGSLQRVIDAVKHLRAQGVKVNLKCPVTRANQDEVLDMHRLARDLGAVIIFDPVITPRDDGDKDPLSLMATDEFLKRYWSDAAYADARKQPVPLPATSVPYGTSIVKRDAVHSLLVPAVVLVEFTRMPPPLRWMSALGLALKEPGVLPRSSAMIAYPLFRASAPATPRTRTYVSADCAGTRAVFT